MRRRGRRTTPSAFRDRHHRSPRQQLCYAAAATVVRLQPSVEVLTSKPATITSGLLPSADCVSKPSHHHWLQQHARKRKAQRNGRNAIKTDRLVTHAQANQHYPTVQHSSAHRLPQVLNGEYTTDHISGALIIIISRCLGMLFQPAGEW